MALKNFDVFIFLIVVSLCGCNSFNNDDDPNEGNFTEIGNGYISASNRKIIITDEQSAFSGLELFVNDNYTGSMMNFTIESGELPNIRISRDFIIIPERLRISNEGVHAEDAIFIKIPVSTKEDQIPIAFTYNKATKSFDPMPIVGYNENSILLASRNFSQITFEEDLKSIPEFDVKEYADIVVGTCKKAVLENHDIIESGFVAGTDGWEFDNWGSVITPDGNCAGMVLSALFYFDYKQWANAEGLKNLYDLDTLFWQDNTLGIRLSSDIQRVAEKIDGSEKAFLEYSAAMEEMGVEAEYDDFFSYYSQIAYQTARAQLLIARKPIYTHIAPGTDYNGLHAVLITAINQTDNTLVLYDPNFAGMKRTAKLMPGGLLSYYSGETADDPDGILYERFVCLGYQQMLDWKKLAEHWRKMENETVGDGFFPTVDYQVTFHLGTPDETTTSLKEFKKDYLFSIPLTQEIEQIRLSCEASDVQNKAIPTNLWVRIDDTWIESGRNKNFVDININSLDLSNKTIGLYAHKPAFQSNSTPSEEWIDFKWVNLSTISIDPKEMSGEINKEYTWEVTLNDPPAKTRFEWNFGDDTGFTVNKNKASAKHTYKQNGTYTILVMAFDEKSNRLIGIADAVAKIGGGEIELTIINRDTEEIIDNQADVCTNLKFTLLVPSGIPDTYEIMMTLKRNDGTEEKEKMSIRNGSVVYAYNWNSPGNYPVKFELYNDKGKLVSQISRSITVTENDFSDLLTSFQKVEADLAYGDTHHLDNGTTTTTKYFFFECNSSAENTIKWTGRSFQYKEESYDPVYDMRTIRIMEGTLSSSCWMMEKFRGYYMHNNGDDVLEFSVEAKNIPAISPPCSHENVSYITYRIEGEDIGQNLTFTRLNYDGTNYVSTDYRNTSSFYINFKKLK
ncbi:MAG TPA: PKD domain-containing protein [Prolixibacteraceae bacterium]|nr:PKD domain-containing protein [Prolixibacteraceae bacterium]